jgi:hypothetical protein
MFGNLRPDELPNSKEVRAVKPFALRALHGKRVRAYDGRVGVITETFYSPLYVSSAALDGAQQDFDTSVTGLCLVSGETAP